MVDTYRIALAMLASVDEVIHEEREVLEHNDTFKGVAGLKCRVVSLYGTEGVAPDILYDALTVGEPTHTNPLAETQIFGVDGSNTAYDVGLFVGILLQNLAEVGPMVEADIFAQYVESAGIDRVVASESSPQTPEGVLGEVLVGCSLNVGGE